MNSRRKIQVLAALVIANGAAAAGAQCLLPGTHVFCGNASICTNPTVTCKNKASGFGCSVGTALGCAGPQGSGPCAGQYALLCNFS